MFGHFRLQVNTAPITKVHHELHLVSVRHVLKLVVVCPGKGLNQITEQLVDVEHDTLIAIIYCLNGRCQVLKTVRPSKALEEM